MSELAQLPAVAQLLLLALAAARITVLLIDDAILELPRGWLLARLDDHPYATKLLTCYWCLGFWVATVLSLSWLAAAKITTAATLPFAVAQAAWWFSANWLGEEDDG